MSSETFDPRNIHRRDMNKLAEAIEEYLDTLWSVMVIPEEIKDKYGDQIEEGFKRCRKFIKKARNGDTSIFHDEDEWNSLP